MAWGPPCHDGSWQMQTAPAEMEQEESAEDPLLGPRPPWVPGVEPEKASQESALWAKLPLLSVNE